MPDMRFSLPALRTGYRIFISWYPHSAIPILRVLSLRFTIPRALDTRILVPPITLRSVFTARYTRLLLERRTLRMLVILKYDCENSLHFARYTSFVPALQHRKNFDTRGSRSNGSWKVVNKSIDLRVLYSEQWVVEDKQLLSYNFLTGCY